MRTLLTALSLLLFCTSVGADVMCGGFGRYRECRVGTAGAITLVRELSFSECFEGVTWGSRSPGVVWVDRGCQGVFRIEEAGRPATGRVVCESENGGHRVCSADTRQGVTLGRQLSAASCVEDVTWGFDVDKRQIWVDDGCRGEFVLGRDHIVQRPVTLDGVVACTSVGGRRAECPADTAAGVQLIRTLSDNACRFGQEWGYDSKKIWVTKGCSAEFAVRATKQMLETLTCVSLPGERYTCDAATEFGVALIRDIGEIECVLDRTWGFDRKGVWVADGCRAQFALGGYRLPPSSVPPTAMRLVCESTAGERKTCAVENVRGAGLVRQTSEAACVLNRTWGYDREGIWVSGGCRAEFAVLR